MVCIHFMVLAIIFNRKNNIDADIGVAFQGLSINGDPVASEIYVDDSGELYLHIYGKALSISESQKKRYKKIETKELVLSENVKCIDGMFTYVSGYKFSADGMSDEGKYKYIFNKAQDGALIIDIHHIGMSSSFLGFFGYKKKDINLRYEFKKKTGTN